MFFEELQKYHNTIFRSDWHDIGNRSDVNTVIYVDEDGRLYVREDCGIIRHQLPYTIYDVIEFRYGAWGEDGDEYYIIFKDNSGIWIIEEDALEGYHYFPNGNDYYTHYDIFSYFFSNEKK